MKPNFISEEQFAAMVKRKDVDPIEQVRTVAQPPHLILALTGQLVSGKNQVQLLFRNGKVHKYPNKTFSNWRAKAYTQILEQAEWGSRTIITKPVHLTVHYTPGDARTRDVSGQLDALFHLLVYSKVLKDDGLVHDVTWRRLPMNRKGPKVDMLVEVL
jgi:Holliday junction resolvase RusA-like endonuclease